MTWLFEPQARRGDAMPLDMLPLDSAEAEGGLFEAVSLLEFSSLHAPAESAAESVIHVEDDAQERARQVRVMVDAAREEAAAEARRGVEAECETRLAAERARVVEFLERFAELREGWFARAERDLAQLAVGVTRRVLEREFEADPVCLAGAVRAALGRVQDVSGVQLRVPPANVADWRGAFAGRAEVEVVGDATVVAGECRLETPVGRVELGFGVQLEEVAARFAEAEGGQRRVVVT